EGGSGIESGVFNAREGSQALQDGFIDRRGDGHGSVRSVGRDGHVGEAGSVGGHGGKGRDPRSFEAETDVLEVPQGMEEKACGDQEKSGQRDFRGYDQAAEPATDGARANAARGGEESALRVEARDEERREKRRDEGGGGGDGTKDENDGPTELDVFGTGN